LEIDAFFGDCTEKLIFGKGDDLIFVHILKMNGSNKINFGMKTVKGVPSTNDALESTNNVFKNESTLRERKSIHKFKVVILEIVSNWSKKYVNNIKTLNDKVPI
jgi:hypothetical protein